MLKKNESRTARKHETRRIFRVSCDSLWIKHPSWEQRGSEPMAKLWTPLCWNWWHHSKQPSKHGLGNNIGKGIQTRSSEFGIFCIKFTARNINTSFWGTDFEPCYFFLAKLCLSAFPPKCSDDPLCDWPEVYVCSSKFTSSLQLF